MTDQAQTPLGLVEIQGPPSSALPDAAPMWRAFVSVPQFGLRRVDDPPPAVQEDRVHPIRTLLLDESEGRDSSPWRMPRLFSLHVVMGWDNGEAFSADELLELNIARSGGRPGAKASITAYTPAQPNPNYARARYFAKTVAGSAERAFHHVIAAPILDDEVWPRKNNQVRVPPLRLVEGAIELLVATEKLKDFAPFLGSEEIRYGPRISTKCVRIRLTADGIEIRALAPFPGSASKSANLLALPSRGGGVIFRLLADQIDDAWRDDWHRVTPAGDREEEHLAGFKIDARRGRAPALEWRPKVDSKVSALPAEVFIPGRDLGVRIVSPSSDRSVDAVAELSPTFYRLAATRAAGRVPLADSLDGKGLLLSAELNRTAPAAGPLSANVSVPSDCALEAGMRLSTAAAGDFAAKLVAAKGEIAVRHTCSYDDVVLAASLREAQGAADPRTSARTEGAEVDTPEPLTFTHPPLSGYVPLGDGWLQFPIENIAPPDPAKDSDLISLPIATPPNVLSGFVRFVQAGTRPPLLSAADGTHVGITEPPWSLAVLGAEAARLEIVLKPSAAGGPLHQAAVHLAQPRLSTRGLLWLSSNRPDAREALPRLSAGPTAFLELPLDSKAERGDGLGVTLTAFEIRWDAAAHALERVALGLTVAPGDKLPRAGEWPRLGDRAVPMLWIRHPHMPLAATMPMTRSARSSTYPLESRDLVAFAVSPKAVWFQLTWTKGTAFPAIDAGNGQAMDLKPLSEWNWTKWGALAQPRPQSRLDGVDLIAFGAPGWELSFDGRSGTDVWSTLRMRLRYDVSGQDEAFATATTPPVPGEIPPPITIATSLDWGSLVAHWSELGRRAAIARTVDNYADDETNDAVLAKGARAPEAKVTTLIGQTVWRTRLGFAKADGSEALPYGTGLIGDKEYRGDVALRGLTETISITRDGGGNASYDVIGFSPVMTPEGDWLVDVQRTGRQPLRHVGPFHWRPIRSHAEAKLPIVGLATLDEPLNIAWRDDGEPSFCFWLKDVGFTKDGSAVVPGLFADFAAWQADRLPLSAAEWRLFPIAPDEQRRRFEAGKERIGFFGLELEPLQLSQVEATMANGAPQALRKISIRCRVHAGPSSRAAQHENNIVELVLTNDGGWRPSIAATQLRFTAPDASGDTDFSLQTTLTFDAQAGLTFSASIVEIATTAMTLKQAAVVEASGETIIVTCGDEAIDPAADMQSLVRLVWLKATLIVGEPAELQYGRRLTIAAGGKTGGNGVPAFVARFRNDLLIHAQLLTEQINLTDAYQLEEFDGAVGLSLVGTLGNVLSSRYGGDLSLGLAASIPDVDQLSAGDTAALTVGTWEASFRGVPDGNADHHGMALEHVLLRARSDAAASVFAPGAKAAAWLGEVELFGEIAVVSAIAWPRLAEPATADATIPLPSGPTGRTWIHVSEAEPALHAVRYILDQHVMDLALATRITLGDASAIWTAAVVGEHTLGEGDRRRTFTAAETIAIGPAAAIVPPVADDAASFAGRYRDKIRANGHEDTDNEAPGMEATGIGKVATVFRGTLGLPFRAAFDAARETGLFLAGGVLGFLERVGEEADLLRLPVLAGLGETQYRDGFLTQGGIDQIQVAWSDGHAQRPLHASGRTAATPTSWNGRALAAAIVAGSVTRWSDFPAAGDPVMAVLSEQFFETSPMSSDRLVPGTLETTPFFIGAAVTVAGFLAKPRLKVPRFVAFLAGPMAVADPSAPGKIRKASLAAAIRISLSTAKRAPAPLREPLHVTVGALCTQTAWPSAAGEAPEAVRRRAFAAELEPRAALLRLEKGDGAATYRVLAVPRRARRVRGQVSATIFLPDAARGAPLGIGENAGWILGLEETIARPIRDDVPGADASPASGVAGLSRAVRLPAEARDLAEHGKDPTWHVQTRVPVYHSLHYSDFVSEPVPWLRGVAARPRVPTREAVEAAWAENKLGEVQSITPETASITSGGDRAGVLTARLVHLETPNSFDGLEFDFASQRYGRPAQAGPFVPMIDRPPRPGPIPTNGAESYCRRMPCASPLFPLAPLAMVRGSADTFRGEEFGGWSATLVAAPRWDAIVTDAWDGTIDVSIEIDVAARDGRAVIEPRALLGLLFSAAAARKLEARAHLDIGQSSIDYRLLVLRPQFSELLPLGGDAKPIAEDDAAESAAGFRQSFSVMLDPSANGDRSSAIDAVGKAMAACEGLPAVSLKLTVCPPAQSANVANPIPPDTYVLATDPINPGAEPFTLPAAQGGPPTTLQFELYPLRRNRGGLPLVPASVIFADQSYDDGLGSVPLSAPVTAVAEAAAGLPEDRGDLQLVLLAERPRAQIGGSLALMLDLAFERRPDPLVRPPALGDLEDVGEVRLPLGLMVQPATGEPRRVYVGTPIFDEGAAYTPPLQPELQLGKVHRLDISRLVEANGRKAELVDGDMLTIDVGPLPRTIGHLPSLWRPGGQIPLASLQTKIANSLRIQLTAVPAVEPPPATYAAMMRRIVSEAGAEIVRHQLALPLYALSPLPRRIVLVDASAGFRTGLIRRAAIFVWTLMRPRAELEAIQGMMVHVVKEERSGQSHRPDKIDELVETRRIEAPLVRGA